MRRWLFGPPKDMKPEVIEDEGFYKCEGCYMILSSDVKYRNHDCYEPELFPRVEEE